MTQVSPPCAQVIWILYTTGLLQVDDNWCCRPFYTWSKLQICAHSGVELSGQVNGPPECSGHAGKPWTNIKSFWAQSCSVEKRGWVRGRGCGNKKLRTEGETPRPLKGMKRWKGTHRQKAFIPNGEVTKWLWEGGKKVQDTEMKRDRYS